MELGKEVFFGKNRASLLEILAIKILVLIE